MKSKIRVLDEQTINLIAAGEVIEDPSSVVKELVDNAIDAGAKKIVIQVQGSGRILISVQDDGCGMCADDALLCFERHATSKIQRADDLWNLHTMGFRGEALASIAAISEVSLLTAEKSLSNGEQILKGTFVACEFGKIKVCQEANSSFGTTISVRSLFQNVPARRKFQKSPAREAQEIIKAISSLALSRPDITFELSVNGKKALFCEASSLKKRVADILGSEYLALMLPVEYKVEGLEFSGFLGKPSACKSNRSGQWLFINERPIDSPFISSCIRSAFGTSIEESRHPQFCLHITTPRDAVDMNVHPQKRHARFCIEEALVQSSTEMVQKALFSFSLPPLVAQHTQREVENKPVSFFLPPKPFLAPLVSVQQELPIAKEAFRIIGTMWHYIFVFFPEPEDEELFSCIDARRACAKIAFDSLKKSQKNECKESELSIQNLLKPIFFEAASSESSLILEARDRLKKCGILVREFGVNAFVIEGYASCYEYVDVKALVLDLVQEKEVCTPFSSWREPKIKLPITIETAFHIVKKLLPCNDPWICPRGLPIRTHISKQEIMKRF